MILGLLMTVIGYVGAPDIAALFLEPSTDAFDICSQGLPLFSLCCLFFTLNIVLIGQEQSLERYSRSTVYMLLRGFLLIVPCFILLPDFIGNAGLWLAVPTSEAITLIIILVVKLVEIRRG